MRINDLHRAVLEDYADGDFAHLAKEEEISRQNITDLGDSLLAFMLIELSGEEDCEGVGTGIERLTHGRDDLDLALAALATLQVAPGATVREGEHE